MASQWGWRGTLPHGTAPCSMARRHGMASCPHSAWDSTAPCPSSTQGCQGLLPHSSQGQQRILHPWHGPLTPRQQPPVRTHMVLLVLEDGGVEGSLLLLLGGEGHAAGEPPGGAMILG